jgi:arylsulfatase
MNRRGFLHTTAAGAAALVLPASARAQARRPNILIVLADDLGFSDIGCYGGEIATPHLDRLAAGGLRFSQFYSTARCWPTRSALLTGWYPQQLHMDPPQGRLPVWARLLPHQLKPLGYRCYHTGKWHVMGAPRPCADGGFDHSYTLDDHDRNFNPRLLREDDERLAPVPKDSGYYTTTAFADHAIRCLREHAKDHAGQPFCSYLAFTVPHFPLHAPPEDIARYRDRYLAGWDQVRTERWRRLRASGIVNCDAAPLEGSFVPRYLKPDLLAKIGPGECEKTLPWAQLSPEQQRFQATKMAVHAAMVDRMDREIGRVLDQVKAMGAWEDTIVFFLSDNGADATLLVRGDGHDQAVAPGSAGSYLCLGPGWAAASNAPFRRHKIWVHEGGTASPLIVHWPAGKLAAGELRHDVGHVVDFVPTLLELAGGRSQAPPEAPAFAGRSLVPAFAKDGSVRREHVFFHHEGNRALRQGDWKLVSAREDNDAWELYDLATDRCEQRNLAAAQPARAKAMADRWQQLEDQFRRDAGPVMRPAQPGGAK